jgi:hypothetical protein
MIEIISRLYQGFPIFILASFSMGLSLPIIVLTILIGFKFNMFIIRTLLILLSILFMFELIEIYLQQGSTKIQQYFAIISLMLLFLILVKIETMREIFNSDKYDEYDNLTLFVSVTAYYLVSSYFFISGTIR